MLVWFFEKNGDFLWEMKEGDKGFLDRKRNISVNYYVMFEKIEKKKNVCLLGMEWSKIEGWNFYV